MHNIFPKRYIFILSIFLLSFGSFAFAQTQTESSGWKILDIDWSILTKPFKEIKILDREGIDMESLRTMYSKSFINADGTITEEIYPTPISYQDELGKWKLINTSIIPSNKGGYDFMNETNLFKTYFTADPFGNKKNVKYQIGDASMEFTSLNGLRGVNTNIVADKLKQDFRDKRTRKLLGLFSTYSPRKDELGKVSLKSTNKLKYPKIVENSVDKQQIDVDYSIFSVKLLEEIVLDKYESITEVAQEFTLTNVYPKLEGDIVNFYHAQTNRLLWHLSKPVMYEVNYRLDKKTDEPSRFENYGLKYEIVDENKDDNRVVIKKVLNAEGIVWLSDSQRVFPIVIDATADYDFQDSTNNKAYYKALTIPTSPTDTTGEASSSNYTTLATSNDARWSTTNATTTGQYDSQIFKFKVNQAVGSISSIYAQWEGYGETASGTYNTYFKIWDNTNSTWTNLQTIDFETAADQTASGTISSNISNYIDASTTVSVLVTTQKGALANGSACSTGGQCQSGNCVDSYCCDTTCNTDCKSCNIAGSLGACSNVAAYNEDGTCTAQCYGCSAGSCVAIGAGSQDTWGSNTCTATHYRCNGGGGCTAPTTLTCKGAYSGTCEIDCTYRGCASCQVGCHFPSCGTCNHSCEDVTSQSCYCNCYTY